MERRYNGRRERAKGRGRVAEGKSVGTYECVTVMWKVQGMSGKENNMAGMRRVVNVVREGWEVLCLTDIRAECDNVLWLREDRGRVVLTHGNRRWFF